MPVYKTDHETGTVTEQYTGAVLDTYTETIRWMMDSWGFGFFALVWDEENERPLTVMVDSGEYGVEKTGAEVDATDEVVEAYKQYLFKKELDSIKASREADAEKVRKGDTVVVTKGRVKKGVVGKVFAAFEAAYRAGYRTTYRKKLGLALTDETEKVVKNGREFDNYKNVAWVWAHNVEHETPNEPDYTDAEENALYRAEQKLLRLPVGATS